MKVNLFKGLTEIKSLIEGRGGKRIVLKLLAGTKLQGNMRVEPRAKFASHSNNIEKVS